jgi:poly-gamma-glutamate synthesis protein (capsule biosynthesis protein)
MECCLCDPPSGEFVDAENKSEGFFAAPGPGGEALKFGGVQAVGIANNVNYGEVPIKASIARLDELGLPHTGAGANEDAARAPVILERGGMKIGILQRTSVYWPNNHEASRNATGVAIIKCHTAYQLPLHKNRPDFPPCNRPGLPPIILTWADPNYLQMFKDDIAALRAKTDFVVASCHWGLHQEVLQYMPEIAHAAIDAGADVVMGHGPHFSLAVEAYKGKPVFYGLGSFCFHTGHGGIKHGNWVGMLPRITLQDKVMQSATFQFVRHNDHNETVLCKLDDERATLEDINKRSAAYGAKLTRQGDQVAISLTQ